VVAKAAEKMMKAYEVKVLEEEDKKSAKEWECKREKDKSEREVENCEEEVKIWQIKVEKRKKRLTLRKREVASEREAADTGLRLALEELRIAKEDAGVHRQRYIEIMLADAESSAIKKLEYRLRSVASAVAAFSLESFNPWAKPTLSTASDSVIIAKCCLTGVEGDE
jgi:hypothetical protein